mmetsp:Transcript_6714/g.17580  ORF Transcript_6714/g.17580 Transcript_6714/m.17580 type:complete len:420 (+) Transcript_6714:137-1396(+)
MAYRELRNFTEVMRSLGYPRLISMENFRNPNFELVADCLYWLLQRYDPGTDVSDDISTESDRVLFLKSVAQVMLTKSRIKLNIKRLYAADGLAVKELLKVALLLYKATSSATDEDSPDDLAASTDGLPAMNSKLFDAKVTRQLASEITQTGSALYYALEREPELREHRYRAIHRTMDTELIERSIQEEVASVQSNIQSVDQMLENLEQDEKNMDAKIEKRKGELERNEKRLGRLQGVRPAYMDEYERLQGDLQNMYNVYLERFRNLEYLESELENYYRAEEEKAAENERQMKKMQRKLRDEEMRILRGEAEVDENGLDDSDSDESDDGGGAMAQRQGQKHGSTMKRDLGAGGYASGRVQGDMMGDDDSGSEGDDLASGSDDSGQLSMGEEDSGSGGGSFIGGDEAELSDLDEASSDNEF